MHGARPLVLIAGAGVAGLETLLALGDLAEDRVEVEAIAPEEEFLYRPLAVAEPFEAGVAHRFDLASLVAGQGARFRRDAVVAVEPKRRLVRTAGGAELAYDSLVITCGGRSVEALPGALTFRGREDREAFLALLDDLAAERARRVAFAAIPGAAWQLPLYELALMTAAQLAAKGRGRDLVLVTPEAEPLALFGPEASAAIRALLRERGIALVTETYPVGVGSKGLRVTGEQVIPADRVVALPRLEGPRLPGVPHDADGFIPTDLHGVVTGLDGVYAAGDAVAFPVKQGGLAAQQADAVAEVIAHQAGAPVEPQPFRPVLRGLLLTGGIPRYLRAEITSGRGETSAAAAEPLWWPPSKIAGRYLAPYLAQRAPGAGPPPSPAIEIEVELEA